MSLETPQSILLKDEDANNSLPSCPHLLPTLALTTGPGSWDVPWAGLQRTNPFRSRWEAGGSKRTQEGLLDTQNDRPSEGRETKPQKHPLWIHWRPALVCEDV